MIAAALATVTTASAAVILMSRPVTSTAHQEAPPRPDRHPRVQSPEARAPCPGKLAVARSDAAAALQPMAQRCDIVFAGSDKAMRFSR